MSDRRSGKASAVWSTTSLASRHRLRNEKNSLTTGSTVKTSPPRHFHTTNPATGEGWREPRSGGDEVNQAVGGGKEAFPKWANLPMKERARLMRVGWAILIDQNVPEIARHGDR